MTSRVDSKALLMVILPGTCPSLVVAEGWAAAEQVAVAVDVVGATHRCPVLALAQRGHGISGLLAAVLMGPVVCGHHLGGMGCVAQGVVLPVQLALLHRADLAAD